MPCHQGLHADNSPGHAARRVRAHQCLFGLTPSTTVLITQARPKFLARQRGEAQRGMLLACAYYNELRQIAQKLRAVAKALQRIETFPV